MTLTERKHCDKCQQETVHLKENKEEELEEECLPCSWYDFDNDGEDKWWKQKIEELGIEKAQQEWEAIRDSDLNQRIVSELTTKDKKEWEAFVKRNDALFLKKKDEDERERERDNQALDYQPYFIGGCIGSGIIAFIWLIVFLVRRD
jgi:hypothetical protein